VLKSPPIANLQNVSGNENKQNKNMKTLILILSFLPSLLLAQGFPKFENDTLYTACGFKIFKGQQITFSKGAGRDGNFKFVKIKGNDNPNRLKNKTIIVESLYDFYISGLGNSYITIRTTLSKENGKSKTLRIKLVFDKAISGFNGFPPEILVPEEFKINSKGNNAEDLQKFYKLFENGIITKEEFEKQKKRILENKMD
jgi:hypothetical protein